MTYIQHDHYFVDGAWHMTCIVRIDKHDSQTGNLVKSRCLRIRIRNHRGGAEGSYAIVEAWTATGWTEVLSRDIQLLHCRSVAFPDNGYELFTKDVEALINQALGVPQ